MLSMIVRRYTRELVLAFLVVSAFVAMNVFAAPSKHNSRAVVAAQPLAPLGKEKTYFDRFREAVQSNVEHQLASQMQAPVQDFRVDMESLKTTPAIPELPQYAVQVLGLGAEGARRLDGLFTITVVISTTMGTVNEFVVNGLMKVTGPVVLAKTNLQRGRIIEQADLETKILPWNTLPTGATGQPLEQPIGRRIKSYVASGSPIWEGVLEENLAIRSGDAVELTVYSGPGIIIRSRGIARQEGRVGEMIRIEQPDTKKAMTATVTGQKSVEVRL